MNDLVRTLPPGYEYVEGPRYQIGHEVRRMARRGEVAVCGPARPVPGKPGTLYVVIKRLRPPRPRWIRPAVIGGGALSVLSGLGMAVYVALREIAEAIRPAAEALSGLVVLSLLLLVVAYVRRGGGRIIEGTFRARIR